MTESEAKSVTFTTTSDPDDSPKARRGRLALVADLLEQEASRSGLPFLRIEPTDQITPSVQAKPIKSIEENVWTRFTRRTITKPRDFIQVLAKVRRQGYGQFSSFLDSQPWHRSMRPPGN